MITTPRIVEDFDPALRLMREDLLAQGYDDVSACAIILTQDGQLLLQRRTPDAPVFPGALGLFGGQTEPGECPADTIVREIWEELGGICALADLTFAAAVELDNVQSCRVLASVYIWRDTAGTIGDCQEGSKALFGNTAQAMQDRDLPQVVKLALQECLRRNLIPA